MEQSNYMLGPPSCTSSCYSKDTITLTAQYDTKDDGNMVSNVEYINPSVEVYRDNTVSRVKTWIEHIFQEYLQYQRLSTIIVINASECSVALPIVNLSIRDMESTIIRIDICNLGDVRVELNNITTDKNLLVDTLIYIVYAMHAAILDSYNAPKVTISKSIINGINDIVLDTI
jgi:hypothetical protein